MTGQVKVTQSQATGAAGGAPGAYDPPVAGGPGVYTFETWNAADARYRVTRTAVAGARVTLDTALDEMERAAVELSAQEYAPGIPLYTQAPEYDWQADPRLARVIADEEEAG